MILFLASTVWAASEMSDSLSVLEAVVKAAPKDGDGWVRLGNAYLDAGENKKADKAFRKGIRYAKSAEAYVGLGRVYLAMGPTRVRNGLKYFRMARAKDRKSIQKYCFLSQILCRPVVMPSAH